MSLTESFMGMAFGALMLHGLYLEGHIHQPVSQEFPNKDVVAIECLALNVYHEARGEKKKGRRAVAHVTMNRVDSKHYPETVCEVVYQRKQFSWTHMRKDHTPHNKDAWKDALKVALEVYYGIDDNDPTKGSKMFHGRKVKPKWRHNYIKVAQIGNHIFYR